MGAAPARRERGGRCNHPGHVGVGCALGQKTRVPRRGALPGHQARSAVEPIPPRHRVPAPPPLPLAGIGASSATVRTPGRPSSPPGARSRSRRPDSTAIATLPGASCFSAAGPKPRQAEGACKKANETMGPARRNAQHAGLNPRKRQGETASRARMREVSRVWTCRVQDIASPESWEDLTVPIRGDGEGLLVPESGTRLGPPPAGAPPPLTAPPSSGAACSRGASARASRGAEAGGGHRRGAAPESWARRAGTPRGRAWLSRGAGRKLPYRPPEARMRTR